MPKVTVLMPVYNCQLYIKKAIDSILNQTYSDFEFMIIDDASTDATVSIIKSYKDPRIQLIEKPDNTGISNSLNLGLKLAKGEYIARMDGDDVSMPKRFEKQVVFLDENPNVKVCGTLYSFIGSDEVVFIPEKHEEIKVNLLFGNCIAHPSVMIRKCFLEELRVSYDKLMEPAEDYALWVDLSSYGDLYNLQECLLKYRVHKNQVSNIKEIKQKVIADNIRIGFLKNLNLEFSDFEKSVLIKVYDNSGNLNIKEIDKFIDLKAKIIEANAIGIFNNVLLETRLKSFEKRVLNEYFFKRKQFCPNIYRNYLSVKRKISKRYNRLDEFKLFVKSTIFWKNL